MSPVAAPARDFQQDGAEANVARIVPRSGKGQARYEEATATSMDPEGK